MPAKNVTATILAVAPDNPKTVYAGDLRDVYRSTDAGASWERLPAPGGAAAALAALPGGVLLAGTPSGLYRSFGRTGWTRTLDGPVERVQLSATASAAIVGGRAFRGDETGANWVACGALPGKASWYGLAFDRDPAGPAYAATSAGLYISTDRCRSFQPVAGLDRATSAAVLSHATVAGEAFTAQNGRVLQTTDSGRSWMVLDDDGMRGSFPSALMVLSGAPRRIFALVPGRGLLSMPLFRLP
jgi:photosystem II stability/assembly factor-like uncharacterized protein